MPPLFPPPRRRGPRPRSREIVLVGNCQLAALANLYALHVSPRNGDVTTYFPSYEALTDHGRDVLMRADVIVEQVVSVAPAVELSGLTSKAERIQVPLISGRFLWPYVGDGHPLSEPRPGVLLGGPYFGEYSDTFLNQLVRDGIDPQAAADQYASLDVPTQMNVGRRYEFALRIQRSRDEQFGCNVASLIHKHLRSERLFLSPHHLGPRLSIALAARMFQLLGADESDIELMRRRTVATPFPVNELPIHPAVADHFELAYAGEEQRYRLRFEGRFTFREFAERYVRHEWNEALKRGEEQLHARDWTGAHDLLQTGLVQSPDSADGCHALGYVLTQQGDLEGALVQARRATAIEPQWAPYRSFLGEVLTMLNRLDDAEREFAAAIDCEPTEPHHRVLAAQNAMRRSDRETATAHFLAAIELAPHTAELYRALADTSVDAVVAMEAMLDAVALEPASEAFRKHLTAMQMHAGTLHQSGAPR